MKVRQRHQNEQVSKLGRTAVQKKVNARRDAASERSLGALGGDNCSLAKALVSRVPQDPTGRGLESQSARFRLAKMSSWGGEGGVRCRTAFADAGEDKSLGQPFSGSWEISREKQKGGKKESCPRAEKWTSWIAKVAIPDPGMKCQGEQGPKNPHEDQHDERGRQSASGRERRLGGMGGGGDLPS